MGPGAAAAVPRSVPAQLSLVLTTTQQIRIHHLLLEREALWARIHACEQEAARLLGEPYPFVRPPLPSDGRGRRKAAPVRAGESPAAVWPAGSPAAAVDVAPPPFPVGGKDPSRRLEEGEAAYRVTYRHLGRTWHEDHTDLAALRTLLACQTPQLQVLRLETIDAAGAVRAVLG